MRPLGTLQQASMSEDRVLFVYRRDRHPLRGVLFLVLSPVFAVAGYLLGKSLNSLWGWMVAVVPLFAAGVAANWGLADLLRPTLFELEIDHRARTLTLSMGPSMAKVQFADVRRIEVAEKAGAWNTTLLLGDGRRVGLGMSATKPKAEEVAAKFSKILGL